MEGKKRKLLLKIGIPVLAVFLIGVSVLLYFGLKPPKPTGPGGPRQVWYDYETFEEMQEAVNNMEYKQEDYYFKPDFDDIIAWEFQMDGIDYCGENKHSREERCNKLRNRHFKIKGSYDGGFTGQNKFFSITFYRQPEEDSILNWTATPREPIDGDSSYETTTFYLCNENDRDIVRIGFYNISEEEISIFNQRIEELVYEFIEQNK
ncbi:MAG: hypothetical protein K2N64_03235 [Anaeroplasmataceae bacterium]|nr:hypothetical protein [Anaeroplasmataceae bacterium]